MDTNITETAKNLNSIYWGSVAGAHKLGILKYPILCLLTLLFLFAFFIRLCADGLLELKNRVCSVFPSSEAKEQAPIRKHKHAVALVFSALLLILAIIIIVPKINTPTAAKLQSTPNANGLAGSTASKPKSSSAQSSQSPAPSLRLDTPACALGAGGIYQFLVKSKTVGTILTKAENSSLIKVELADANDKRGRLFTITGLGVGTTTVTVTNKNSVSSFPVTVTKSAITLDTTSYVMAPSDIYDIKAQLIGQDAKELTVYSSDKRIASIKQQSNGRYRVTGHQKGACEIVFEVGGMRVSTQITVQTSVQSHGDSTPVVGTL